MASGPITSCQTDGKTMEIVADFIFGGAPKSPQMVAVARNLRHLLLGRKAVKKKKKERKAVTAY